MSQQRDLPPKKRKLSDESSIINTPTILKSQNSSLLTRLKDKRTEIAAVTSENEQLRKDNDNLVYISSRIKSLWGQFVNDIDIICQKLDAPDEENPFDYVITRYTSNVDKRLEELGKHAGLRMGQLQSYMQTLKHSDYKPAGTEEELQTQLDSIRLELSDSKIREANLREEVAGLTQELTHQKDIAEDRKFALENLNVRLQKASSLSNWKCPCSWGARDTGQSDLPDFKELKTTILNLQKERDTLLTQRDEQIKRFQELKLHMEISEERFIQCKAFQNLIDQASIIKKQLEKCREENLDLKKRRDDFDIEKSKEIREIELQTERQQEELLNKINELRTQLHESTIEKQNLQNEISLLQIKLQETKSLGEYKGLLESSEQELCRLKDSIQKLKHQNQEYFSTSEENYKKVLVLQDSNMGKDLKLNQLYKQIEAAPRPHSQEPAHAPEEGSLEARVEHYRSEAMKLRQRIKKRDDKVSDLESKRASFANKVKSEQQNNEALIREIDLTEKAYAEMQAKNTALVNQIQEKDEQLSKMMTEQHREMSVKDIVSQEQAAFEEKLNSANSIIFNQKELITSLELKNSALLEVHNSLKKTLQQIETKLLRYESNDSAYKIEELNSAKAHSLTGLKTAERKIVVNATEAMQYQMYFQQKEKEVQDLKAELQQYKDESSTRSVDEALNAELQKYRSMIRCGICGYRTKSVVLTKCFHSFWKACIDNNLEMRQRKWPTCMTKFGADDVRTFWWKQRNQIQIKMDEEMMERYGRHSNAGKIIAQYLNVRNKPKVNYPKFQVRQTSNPPPSQPKQKPQIDYPPITKKLPRRPAAIRGVQHRKNKAQIDAEMRQQQLYVGPPSMPKPGVDRDAMKNDLQNAFLVQPGALPIKTHMPAVPKAPIKKATPVKNQRDPQSLPDMFDAIVAEIEERQKHLDNLDAMGQLNPNTEHRIKGEIASRVGELEKIKKMLNKS